MEKSKKRLAIILISAVSIIVVSIVIIGSTQIWRNNSISNETTIRTSSSTATTSTTVSASSTPTEKPKATITPISTAIPTASLVPSVVPSITTDTQNNNNQNEQKASPSITSKGGDAQNAVTKETQAPPPPTETQAPPPPTETAAPVSDYVPNIDNIKNQIISLYQSSGQWNPNGTYMGDSSMSIPVQGSAFFSDYEVAEYYYRNKFGGNTSSNMGMSAISINISGNYIEIATTKCAIDASN